MKVASSWSKGFERFLVKVEDGMLEEVEAGSLDDDSLALRGRRLLMAMDLGGRRREEREGREGWIWS